MKKLSQIPKQQMLFAGVAIVLLLGIFDTISGREVSFSVFYMLPIYLATWYCGRWQGIFVSLLSAATWLVADLIAGPGPSHALIPLWNMAVRLTFFLLMTYLLSELQIAAQRRQTLERIFFHDILNLVGSVRGFAELLKDKDVPATQEIFNLIYEAADRSLEDIEAQRTLAYAEKDELSVTPTMINCRLLINLVTDLYRHHDVARGKTIVIKDTTQPLNLVSDHSILSRVLGNMLKNALEAIPEGGVVTIGCTKKSGKACFSVHNDGVIPERVREQIFHHAISTKGKGRGIGTYSMKLLTECLHGNISFVTNDREGTTFTACYPLIPPWEQTDDLPRRSSPQE